ncbi:AAA family ATPase [Xanthocytophaga flava]|uniref:AAA family ATPase n=1 Tax=Xanthocytophaga flava TaxID=3048013 RepID=UPI0028D79E44|nr:AAA family ATPase [Xanthocytophaga flavus]MDJ1472754.1 AAA family ATPase [Xanthocytophaga flavus]
MNRKERIRLILEQLRKGVYEKEEAIQLSLLAALAGESIFLLGPPGVAKSLIARKLKFAFRDGRSFEYLMNRFSTPDEIFGPVSIKKLKEEDRYERLTEKYLPGANVVFLDEIWKAGPAIQNALLTVLNERVYRNGEQEVKVNIKAIVSASNELPVDENLNALWDRFLVRYMIREIRKAGSFVDMIVDTSDIYQDTIPSDLKIGEAELQEWDMSINEVQVPAEVLNVIQMVKYQLEQYDADHPEAPFHIFDRRWKKLVRLLRTSAFLNERVEVDLMDCFLMPHILWSKPEQLEIVREIVAETIRKHGYSMALEIHPLRKEIRELEEEVMKETRIPNVVLMEIPKAIEREYYELLNTEQTFDGNRIKRSDFDRMVVGEESPLNLYDKNGSLVNRVKARKSAELANGLIINANARLYTFHLLTDKVEKKEFLYKKPHTLVQKYWDDRTYQLRKYITDQKAYVDEHRPVAMQHLRTNLFVESELADLVEMNLKEALATLDELDLQIDKIKHLYESLR